MSVSIDFSVDFAGWDRVPGAHTTIRRAIEAAVHEAGPANAEVGVVLTGDERIRTLNRTWRNQDAATNVLSFSAADEAQAGAPMLGDVVLALETIQREAAEASKPFEHHLAHLAVHGVLHLLGYDHERDGEAEAMEASERAILSRLGVPDPYASSRQRRTEPA